MTDLSGMAAGSAMGFVARLVALARLLARHRYGYSPMVRLVAVVRPLIDVAVVYLIFSRLLDIPVNEYLVYLVCGLVPWGFFRRGIVAATSLLIVRKPLVLNAGMAPAELPLAAVTAEFGKFLFAFGVLLIFVFTWFRAPQPIHLMLPLALLPLVVSTYALGVAAACFAVLRRGLSHLIPLVLFVIFWMTPVVYHWSILPGWLQPIVRYNPFTLLLSGAQVILHGNTIPSMELFAVSYVVALATTGLAVSLYWRIRSDLPFRL